jgi:hypothetical protein
MKYHVLTINAALIGATATRRVFFDLSKLPAETLALITARENLKILSLDGTVIYPSKVKLFVAQTSGIIYASLPVSTSQNKQYRLQYDATDGVDASAAVTNGGAFLHLTYDETTGNPVDDANSYATSDINDIVQNQTGLYGKSIKAEASTARHNLADVTQYNGASKLIEVIRYKRTGTPSGENFLWYKSVVGIETYTASDVFISNITNNVYQSFGKPSTLLGDGNWHQIVRVFDGSQAGNGKIRIWVDNSEQTLSFSGTLATTLPDSTGANLYIGGDIYGGKPSAGCIDEFFAANDFLIGDHATYYNNAINHDSFWTVLATNVLPQADRPAFKNRAFKNRAFR